MAKRAPKREVSYDKLAKKIVERALKRGARQAEAYLEVGRQSSCRVRDQAIEDVTQSTFKGLGLRVISKNRLGFVYTSDFDEDSLNALVDRAIQLAETSAPNRLNGLPTAAQVKRHPELTDLFDAKIAKLPTDWKVRMALEIERAGKAFDKRISTFESVGAGDFVAELHVASSEGLSASTEATYAHLYAVPVASDGKQLQTSHWMDAQRFLEDLEAPESVGRQAAMRAVRMLGARKVKSCRVPVILDPLMASGFVGNVSDAVNGDLVYKNASFLGGKLGKRIANEHVTIVDDGTRHRGLGTTPFDGEGVATRRTPLVEKGVLKSFLYDAFTARKAKARSTGNASRGYSSLPHIDTHNLYLEAGDRAPEEIIGEVKQGLYVTAMLGRGADPTSGDYSRGANGLWIENGELTRPVQEVTVAGNLVQMLQAIDAVGNDLTFRGSSGAPTVRFAELTVSGE